jgi:hypothetical protein
MDAVPQLSDRKPTWKRNGMGVLYSDPQKIELKLSEEKQKSLETFRDFLYY